MKKLILSFILFLYDKIIIPYSIFKIHRKKKIKVLFILTNISLWKTELLYIQMLRHPRFNPIIGIVPTLADTEKAYQEIKDYCESKKYSFIEINKHETLIKQTHCDIIFYSQPYMKHYYKPHRFTHNLKALFLHISYGVHSVLEEWNINQPLFLHCWQYYFENDIVASDFSSRMKNKGKNITVTGLPMFDQFVLYNSTRDPWKPIEGEKKKRVIYAPHHTINSSVIKDASGINYSTFLEYGEFMLEMAEKYKDKIQFTFKPHPYLWRKLITVWGEEKAKAYYQKWEQLSNCQIENGEYVSLFMTSDALIHDCSSFTIEYHFTSNPVLYLVKEESHDKNISRFGKEAYNLHYKGFSKEDIESFLNDIINDIDPIKEKRKKFYNQYLLPPNGKTACENIINSIIYAR